MTQVVEAHSCAKSLRSWSERKSRVRLRKPDRLTGVDMRTRVGRAFSAAFISAVREFPGADPAKVAEVARLRSIAALAQSAALTGSGSTAAALRATASAERARRDLGSKTP
jgi:hypothetical protein